MRRKEIEVAQSAADDGPPARWLSAAEGGDAPADRLAALIRAGETAGGLGPASRARVWARLTQARPVFFWRGLIGLRWAVAVIVLLTSGVVIGSVAAHRFWPPVAPKVAPATDEAPARRRAKPTPKARRHSEPGETGPASETASESAAAEPAPLPAPALPAAATPAAVPVRAPALVPARSPGSAARVVARPVTMAMTAPAAPPPVTAPAPVPAPAVAPPPAPTLTPPLASTQSTLAAETELLQEAVSRLRLRGNAGRALAVLDAYDERFPRGTLRREADGARVDALLLLGRDDEALGVLRTLALRPQGRDQELQVIRGELSAPARCARAIADFDAVLAQSPPAALAERALYGRAACRLRQHDGGAAARDLQEVLRRFPSGPFAADARRAMRENSLSGTPGAAH